MSFHELSICKESFDKGSFHHESHALTELEAGEWWRKRGRETVTVTELEAESWFLSVLSIMEAEQPEFVVTSVQDD